MNTPTHVIAASAILARPDAKWRNRAVLAGALLPDLSIYVLVIWAAMTGGLDNSLWTETYWTEPWQTLGAISNSIPLALAVLGVAIWKRSSLFTVFAGALLIHAALDLPVHADDAHRHFWPVSDLSLIHI